MNKTPIEIFFNGRFLTQPLTGVQRFAFEVIGALDGMIDRGEIDCAAYRLTCLAPRHSNNSPSWKWISVQPVGGLTGNLWEQIDLPRHTRGNLLINLCNVGPFMKPFQAVTIHDTAVFAVPQSYTLPFRLKYRLNISVLGRRAPLIFTVSQFSKTELVRYLHISPEKIHVVPEGSEHILEVTPDPAVFERFSIGQRPYFLVVSSKSSHKNLPAVLEATRLLEQVDFDLVIAGGTYSKFFRSENYDFPLWVKDVGVLKDAELAALYRGAVGLIFPSLYEGFGLPPLEAMACGCPVIVSRAASLPEVCGEAALYCDPYDPADIACQIQRLLDDSALQAKLRQAGLRQAKRFSWTEAARLMWREVENLVGARIEAGHRSS